MAFNSWSGGGGFSSGAQGGWGSSPGQSSDEQLFFSLGPTNGRLSGAQVRSVFQQSGLPKDQLAIIWSQVDKDKDGFINKQEFCEAMNYIRRQQGSGNSAQMSQSMSTSVISPSPWGSSNPAHSLPIRSYNSSNTLISPTGSTPSPYLENKSFFPSSGSSTPTMGESLPSGGRVSTFGTPSPSMSVSGGVGRNVSLSSLTPTWAMTPMDKRKYIMTFNTNDRDKTGYLSGEAVRNILVKYDLEKNTLRQIWELSDVDKDGRLSVDEFCIALFLVDKATKGIPPPTTLPLELQPKKGPHLPSVSGQASPLLVSNLEEKKRENFEKGKAELERRRKAIQEREQKEKEEKERKRLEEEERKRQEEQRLAALREAEMERQKQKALEIERERERAIQQALMKKEAEQREAEQKRKEEWTKRRIVELEQERKREQDGLNTVKHQHQSVMDQLTRHEVEKQTMKQRIDQERQRCAQLASGLDQAKGQHGNWREQLVGVANDLKNWRQELNKMEFHRQQLQGRLAVQMTGNEGEVHSQLTNRQQALANTLNRLRGVVNENNTKCEQLREETRVKQEKTMGMLNDIKAVQNRIAQLKAKKQNELEEVKRKEQSSARQQAFEEIQRRQKEVQQKLKAQKEEEKRKKDEEKRKKDEERKKREQYEKERSDMVQEEEMQSILENEFKRFKKMSSVDRKELPETNPTTENEVVRRSKSPGKGGGVRPRSQVLSEEDDVMKKVAELQARKKDLEVQRNSPKMQGGGAKGLLPAFEELEGINFATGQTMTALPTTSPFTTTTSTKTIAPPMTTPTTSTTASPHLYESTYTQPKTTPTNNTTVNNSPIYETPDAWSTKQAAPTPKPVVPPKPTLPPKPEFLKHSIHKESSSQAKPTDKPQTTPNNNPPMYEIVSPFDKDKPEEAAIVTKATPINSSQATPTNNPLMYEVVPVTDKPKEVIYDEPPKDLIEKPVIEERIYDEPPKELIKRPAIEERIYNEPPKELIKRPAIEERIYDEPPKEIFKKPASVKDNEPPKETVVKQPPPEERIYDLPPLEIRPLNEKKPDVHGNMLDQQYGNVLDQQYGNVLDQQYGNVQDQQYGNEPNYGNVPEFGNEAEYGNVPSTFDNPFSTSNSFYENTSFDTTPPTTADQSDPLKGVIPPTSPIASISISYRARFQYTATNEGELSFNQGDILTSSSGGNAQDGWIKVEKGGQTGWAPINYLQPIEASDSTSSANDKQTPTSPSSSSTSKISVRVKHVWNGNKPNHLSLKKGQVVVVKEKGESGWWLGELEGKIGWFPHKFVEDIVDSDPSADTQSMALPEVNELYKAIYSFQGEHEGDLSFPEGCILTVLKKDGDWWHGEYNEVKGMFPSNYVSPLADEPNPTVMDSLGIPLIPNMEAGATMITPKGSRKHPLLGRVIVGFTGIEEGQLSLVPGQLVVIRRQESNGWWEGQLQSRGEERRCGWFPANRIELMTATALSGQQTMSPKHSAVSVNSVQSVSGSGPDEAPPTTTLVLALYSYTANSTDELTFHKGSVISLISKDEADWWKGELNGQTGLFPSNYVQPLDTLKQSDPIHWSDHVKPEIIDKVPPKERKRQEAIFELIHSEKSYVFSLNLVKEVFFIPLENSNILTQDEMIQVFVNWEEIIEHNTAFCNALFIRLRTSGAIVRIIGDVLHDYIPQLSSHIRWCSCQLNACTLLQSKSSDPQFKEFEQNCMKDTRTGGLPLSSFLLKPMQRVTKYPLLIKKILEYTQPAEADYELLLISMTMAEDLCSQVNEAVKQKENSEKLEWIQTHVQMIVNEKLVFNSSTNFMGSRKLLHSGKVLKVRGNKEMVLFLFNDFLLLARPKAHFATTAQTEPFNADNYFIMHREPFLLDQIQVKKIPDEKDGFTILPKQSNDKDVPFKCETEVARNQWIKLIMNAIVAFTQRKKQSSKLSRSDSRRVALQRKSVGKLIITIIEASDLIASSDGKSDPFCVVKVGDGQEAHTPVVKNSLNPQWNYAMEFFVSDFDSQIHVSVFDSDLFSPNDFLGCAKVNLKQLREEGSGPWVKRVLLEDVAKGEIELRLAFRHQGVK